MSDEDQESQDSLCQLPYRLLQQQAKAFGLPSNVKKVYLIKMIRARKYLSEKECDKIVQMVKLERQHASTGRKQKKKELQASEITSSNKSMSPPIDITPKRPLLPDTNPNRSVLLKSKPKNTTQEPPKSDRVLRSFNVKSYKKPNYSLMNDSFIEILEAQSLSESKQMSIKRREDNLTPVIVRSKGVQNKFQPNLLQKRDGIVNFQNNGPTQIKRRRVSVSRKTYQVSGPEYPVIGGPTSYTSMHVIDYRDNDGKMTKINAIVRRPVKPYDRPCARLVGERRFSVERRYQSVKTHSQKSDNGYQNADNRYQHFNQQQNVGNRSQNVGSYPIAENSYQNVENHTQTSESGSQTIPLKVQKRLVVQRRYSVERRYQSVKNDSPKADNRYQNANNRYQHLEYYYQNVDNRQNVGNHSKNVVRYQIPKNSAENHTQTIENGSKTNTLELQNCQNVENQNQNAEIHYQNNEQHYENVDNCYRNDEVTIEDIIISGQTVCVDTQTFTNPSTTECSVKQYYENNEHCFQNVEVTIQDIICGSVDTQTFSSPSTSQCPVKQHNDENCYQNVKVTIQDIIKSGSIDTHTFTDQSTSECMSINASGYVMSFSANNDEASLVKYVQADGIKGDTTYSTYFDEKIWAEQFRPKRMDNDKRSLPKICDAFSKFKNVARDVTRPLYPQVSSGDTGLSKGSRGKMRLSKLYNLEMKHPRVKLTDTNCVDATPLIASIVAQVSSTASIPDYCTPYNCTQYQNAVKEDLSQMCDFTLPEQDKSVCTYQACSTSTSSAETLNCSEEAAPKCSTPPLKVLTDEDLLEITQDEDFLQRITLEERMQCILCDWAGSKYILEFHIIKEHPEQVTVQGNNEWNVTYKLSSVVNQGRWLSHVSDYQSSLYIVSVKYEHPDCFMASLSVLTMEPQPNRTGSITIYNKVTGEPYTWDGVIPELDTNMPYGNTAQLKLEMSKMELVPNSANLKLLGKSLVPVSPGRAVVGQAKLNDIHIIIFVRIY